MKLLIIGSDGFIGSHCSTFFKSKGFQVIEAGIRETNKANYFRLNSEQTDFTDVFVSHTYDICINASGSANVGFSFEKPDIDYELNVLNVQKLLVAIRKYNPKCKFINFSSAAVYGNPNKLPIQENFPTHPLSPYGFHKLQSEYLLKEYHKFFGLHTCNVRIFSAYGSELKKQLFWDLYQKALQLNQNEKVELFGTGEESRDFIFIDDLLQLIDKIIENSSFCGEVINAASGVECKIKEVVTTFYDLLYQNLDIKVSYEFSGKVKVGDPNNWKADISLAKTLGFVPQFDTFEGLTNYTKWLKTIKTEKK